MRLTLASTPCFRYLGAGNAAPGADAFEAFRADVASTHPKCQFVGTVAELPQLPPAAPVLALIAGRTADAPRFFEECLAKGVSQIYLEKPGADSADKLEALRKKAADVGVPVLVGYNKNVAEYTREALTALARRRASDDTHAPLVTLEHCNAFSPGRELVDFLSGPGAEGMLHNMGCHELALAATLFGVTPARVASLTLHSEASEIVPLADGKADWSRVSFTLALSPTDAETPAGAAPTALKFAFDRCGGNFSCIHLGEAAASESFRLPSAEHQAWVDAEAEKDPLIRPYFLQQAPDYRTLKAVFVQHIRAGKTGTPPAVVDIDGAVAALRLADMLRPALLQCWEKGAPWTWHPPSPSPPAAA